MWQVVGLDEDGTRHICRRCATKEEAEQGVIKSQEGLKRIQATYADSLMRAVEEYREIKKMTPRKRPKYYDYMGWKMQGFFIKEFRIEEVIA
jgi:hypothetical protein